MPTIPVVQADARSKLVSFTEEHITQLVREAVQVQHHCKRARFHLSNEKDAKSGPGSTVGSAASKNKSRVGILRRRLHADDINMALQWRGSEKIYATGIVGGGSLVNSSSRDDKKVVLQDYLKSEIKVRPPQEVGLTLHWLAVDGVQPNIPQNPAGVASTSTANTNKRKKPVVHRVEEEEEEDASGGDGVQVTQLLPRLISEELRLYFSRITGAVERGGATPITRQQQDTALASLTRDPGLQELIPFMINYVTKNLYKHLGNPEHCRTLIRMAQALLANPYIHLELYVSEEIQYGRSPSIGSYGFCFYL
jgi:transcription initiation factor TFIID subunit 6